MKLILLATAMSIFSIPLVFREVSVAYYSGHRSMVRGAERPGECPCRIDIDTSQHQIVIVHASDSAIGEYFRIDSFCKYSKNGGDSALWCYCTKRVWKWKGKMLYAHTKPAQVVYEWGRTQLVPDVMVIWTDGDSMRRYQGMPVR